MAQSQARRAPLLDTDRINAFSDGIFAIAATLLVLEIHIPSPEDVGGGGLGSYLANHGFRSQVIGFVVSFLVVAVYRTAHHRFFARLAHTDSSLTWLNTLFLLLIAFLPFPTALFSDFQNDAFAFNLYSGTLAAAGVVICLFWLYVGRHAELLNEGDPGVDPLTPLRIMLAPLVFLLSMLVAQWNLSIAPYVWLAIIPASAIENYVLRRVEKRK